jgi:hypothetical protein
MKNPFRKYDFSMQEDRDKMLWTDRDLAFAAAVGLVVGYFFGWIA